MEATNQIGKCLQNCHHAVGNVAHTVATRKLSKLKIAIAGTITHQIPHGAAGRIIRPHQTVIANVV
jgi:hypothetical protein